MDRDREREEGSVLVLGEADSGRREGIPPSSSRCALNGLRSTRLKPQGLGAGLMVDKICRVTDIFLWFIAVMTWRICEWGPIDMTEPARKPLADARFKRWIENIQ
jgi:hypothetical protein